MKYCEAYAALLDPYVDGELSGEEAERVRAHLKECPGCRAYVDGALAVRSAFPDVEETEVPEGFAQGVMAAVRELEGAKKTGNAAAGRTRWGKILLPLAACFAIVLVIRYGPPQGAVRSGGADNAAPSAAAPSGGFNAADSGGAVLYKAAPAESETSAANDAAAAPQMGPEAPEPPGGAADMDSAAVPRIAADAPAASDGYAAYSGVQEETEEGAAVPTAGSQPSASRAVRLTAAQAGELLADLPALLNESGVRCYQLTDGEFEALLEALAERDVVPEEAESAPELEALSEGYHLVYVTEE